MTGFNHKYTPRSARPDPVSDLVMELYEMRRVENEHAALRKRLKEMPLERRARQARVDRRRERLLSDPARRLQWDTMREVMGDEFDELKFWQGHRATGEQQDTDN